MRVYSGGVSLQRTVLALAAVLALWSSSGSGFNIDTQQPIVREPPAEHTGQLYDLFGYTAVLHSRRQADPSTTSSTALDDAVILIAAPNGTAENAAVDNTGIVFECPLTQGPCMPFSGSGSGMDLRLYDMQANTFGLKEGQFLGISMDSTGDRFIVCGHKFQDSNNFPETGGVCYLSGRDLTGFQQLLPCFNQQGINRLDYQFEGDHCGAGASVSLLNNNNIALGAPALGYRSRNFRGATIVLNEADGQYYFSHRDDPEGHPFRADDDDANFFAAYSDYHRGYSVSRGHVIEQGPNGIEDIIVGLPRGHAGRYLGAVGIHRQVFNREIVTLPDGTDIPDNYLGRLVFLFEGDQLGSYFGGTVTAVDVNGDGYDEVFVAASLYTPTRDLPEAGRVTVFLNLRGTLTDQSKFTIEGPRRAYGRFGHAMTGVGDVNADGFQDIAISAPFRFGADPMDSYSGAVYIYAGSNNGLQGSPIQVIEQSSLNLEAAILSGLTGFGAHLFSADVDNNGYNDLLVGAFQSRKVFVLRARPVLNVIVSTVANISSFNETGQCEFMMQPRSCFSVSVCIRTTGRGFTAGQQFTVGYNLSSDPRVFFGDGGLGSTMIQDSVMTTVNGTSSCNTHIVYLTVAEIDIDTPLAVTAAPFVEDSLVQLAVTDGNPLMPEDLANRPATLVSGQTQALILPNLDCGEDGVCRTDLQVQAASLSFLSRARPNDAFSQITIGLVSEIIISFNLINGGPENAYRSVAIIRYSTAFAFSRIEGNNGVTCMQLGQGDMNTLTCQVTGLLGPGAMVQLGVRLVALDGRLSGLEETVSFSVNATSNSEELLPADNFIELQASVISQADAQVIISPDGLQFVSLTGTSTDFRTVNDFSSIGRQVTFNTSVINHGPSAIGSASVSISWPIAHTCTGNTNFLFYLASIQLVGVQGACRVDPTNARDYLMIATQETGGIPLEDEVTTVPGVTRSTPTTFSHPFVAGSQEGSSLDCTSPDLPFISVDCSSADDACVAITCDINGHLPNRQGVISITGYIDDAFFASEERDWSVAVSANYTITDQSVTEVTGAGSRENSDQVTVSIISPLRPQMNASVPIWVIVVPIVLALIFIVIVVIILYACGFFRRKNWKKLQEEEENGADNGNGSDNAQTENVNVEPVDLPKKEDIAYVNYK